MEQDMEDAGGMCSTHGKNLSAHATLTDTSVLLSDWGGPERCLSLECNMRPAGVDKGRTDSPESTKRTSKSTSVTQQWIPREGWPRGSTSGELVEFGSSSSSADSSIRSLLDEHDLPDIESLAIHGSGNTSQDEDPSVTEATKSSQVLRLSEGNPRISQPILKVGVIDQLHNDRQFENDFFAVRHSPIAGLGAFAKQDLNRGDIILQEAPLFTSNCRTLTEDFERLDQAARQVALDLAQNEYLKTGTLPIQAVMWTNSFATRIDGSMSGLFAIAARFNHACKYANNVDFHYDPKLGFLILTVKAATIRAGQEITLCYGTERSPFRLWNLYGFQCYCGACPGISDHELRAIEHKEFFG